ncbi:UNVERIFIED_CONTAM: hypothetical protein FKN15_025253 [Acipenser sinensis]
MLCTQTYIKCRDNQNTHVCLAPFSLVIKVYNEDDTSRALEVPSDITARDVCQLFILKNHCIDDHSWTLFEHRALIGIERTIEDHESVIEVQSSWGMETDDRLYFRKNYAKYEFFKKPLEPRHLQFVAEFSDSDVYTLLAGRKKYGAPTDYGFCIKHNQSGGARGLKLLCADEEQIRICWVTAIRLFKYGMQLYQNYIQPYQKQKASPVRSISENSLVAMDFSGHKSRVIENPTEALSVAVEEGLSWRRKSCLRLNPHGGPSTQSPTSNLAVMAGGLTSRQKKADEQNKKRALLSVVCLTSDGTDKATTVLGAVQSTDSISNAASKVNVNHRNLVLKCVDETMKMGK